jgi:hypothetical protein
VDPSLYITSILALAVLLGLLLVGVIIGADRVLARRSRSGERALVRVEISMENGVFTANYDEHRGRPKNVPPVASLTEICASLDEAISSRYQRTGRRAGLIVSYDIFPWHGGEVPKELVAQIGTDWLVFNVAQKDTGFTARHEPTALAVTAASLDQLPGAVEAAVISRWPEMAPEIAGVLSWERSLTDVGRG